MEAAASRRYRPSQGEALQGKLGQDSQVSTQILNLLMVHKGSELKEPSGEEEKGLQEPPPGPVALREQTLKK